MSWFKQNAPTQQPQGSFGSLGSLGGGTPGPPTWDSVAGHPMSDQEYQWANSQVPDWIKNGQQLPRDYVLPPFDPNKPITEIPQQNGPQPVPGMPDPNDPNGGLKNPPPWLHDWVQPNPDGTWPTVQPGPNTPRPVPWTPNEHWNDPQPVPGVPPQQMPQITGGPTGLGPYGGGNLQSLGLDQGSMVNLRGPDGSMKAVPQSDLAHWLSKGAVRA